MNSVVDSRDRNYVSIQQGQQGLGAWQRSLVGYIGLR
jgi:hypothetical protein